MATPTPNDLRPDPSRNSLDAWLQWVRGTFAGATGVLDTTYLPTIPASKLPYIGWHLDKNASNQGSVGTGSTLISWSSAGAASWSNGVTLDLTAGNHKITLPTAGLYWSIVFMRFSVIAANDSLVVAHTVSGATVSSHRARHAAGADTVPSFTLIKAAANDYVQIHARNETNADTVDGAAINTIWMGGLFGAAA